VQLHGLLYGPILLRGSLLLPALLLSIARRFSAGLDHLQEEEHSLLARALAFRVTPKLARPVLQGRASASLAERL
jgi:hypothetical protein